HRPPPRSSRREPGAPPPLRSAPRPPVSPAPRRSDAAYLFSLYGLAQLGPHLRPRLEQLALARPRRDAQQLADLLVRVPLDVVENQHPAHSLRQPVDRLLQAHPQQRTTLRLRRRKRLGELQLPQLVPLPPPPPVEGAVD